MSKKKTKVAEKVNYMITKYGVVTGDVGFCFSNLFVSFLVMFYGLCYYIVLILPLCPTPPSNPPLSQAIPTPSFTSMGHVCKFFGYSISYTALYIPMATL